MAAKEIAHALTTRIDTARRMLCEVKDAKDAKYVKNLAESAKLFAQRQKLGRESVNHVHAIIADAWTEMGRFLVDSEIRPGQPKKNSTNGEEFFSLENQGITFKESSAAQFLFRLRESDRASFELFRNNEKTLTAIRREVSRSACAAKADELPSGIFRVVYADPPWKYGDQLTEAYGATKYHYPAMSIDQLCDMPIGERVAENAVLFLWVTSPLLDECWPVIDAWGFRYASSFVWDKVKHNMGHYNSVRHEFLLICVRGSCLPDSKKLVDSVQTIERSEKHSQKPPQFIRIIETMYPRGRKLELFGREKRKGWTVWGNQINES